MGPRPPLPEVGSWESVEMSFLTNTCEWIEAFQGSKAIRLPMRIHPRSRVQGLASSRFIVLWVEVRRYGRSLSLTRAFPPDWTRRFLALFADFRRFDPNHARIHIDAWIIQSQHPCGVIMHDRASLLLMSGMFRPPLRWHGVVL